MPSPRAEPSLRRRSTQAREGDDAGPGPKRRQVRKGTRSCWECRRLKMKCIFASSADAICTRCQRRGAKCVGQEFPEEVSAPLERSLQMGDRVVRVETLLQQLLEKNTVEPAGGCTTCRHNGKHSDGALTLPSPGSESSPVLASHKPSRVGFPNDTYLKGVETCSPSKQDSETVEYEILDGGTGLQVPQSAGDRSAGIAKYGALSRRLHELLPPLEDSDLISKARGDMSALFHQMLTVPYYDLDRTGSKSLESLLKRPGPEAHPALIARHMLHVATFLQHLHPDLHSDLGQLSEPPRAMMQRLADTAISLVTTNDDLVASIEGLECVVLESLFQSNGGNLRKGLIAIRRAMILAQLMGFDQPGSRAQHRVLSPDTKAHPQFLWFRIVLSERHLCLMLGIPQGSLDRGMASEALLQKDTPMGRLERVHCVIASRILERNQGEPGPRDSELTRELDGELQRAAGELDSKWWLPANLATLAGKPEDTFWAMRRLFHQLFHFYLLNQLHLPYMLRSAGGAHNYSRMTCVNAAREVLSRFIMFSNSSRVAFSCRTVDFISLIAAMTLLLAHVDGHRRVAASALAHAPQLASGLSNTTTMTTTTNAENLLAHQRPGDLAMVEQAQESMEDANKRNGDVLSAQSAELLRRLRAIEAGAADADGSSAQAQQGSCGAVRLCIPHFGIIVITRDGIISKTEVFKQPQPTQRDRNPVPAPPVPTSSVAVLDDSAHLQTGACPAFCLDNQGGASQVDGIMLVEDAGRSCGNLLGPGAHISEPSAQSHAVRFDPMALQGSSTDPSIADVTFLQQQYEYPLLTAGVDDWAFQGVDMAFFDSLMRGVANDGSDGTEWLNGA
jgi:hypothetical protein